MTTIFRLSDTAHDAVDRTVHAAHQAQAAGYEHVQTGYDPAHQTYTVNADPPGQQPTRSPR